MDLGQGMQNTLAKLDWASPLTGIIPENQCGDFIRDSFEKHPFHFKQGANPGCRIDLDEFYTLLRTRTWPDKLSFVQNGEHKTNAELRNKLLDAQDQLTLDKLVAIRAARTTVVVHRIDRFHLGIRDVIFQLRKSGLFTANANAYFTPANAQGFLPHWDTHDVFVVQIAGTKHWHLAGEPSINVPTEHDAHRVYDGYTFDTETELDLKPGEVLYIPRGFGHYAQALESDSLHITIGAMPLRWIDLLEEIVGKAALVGDETLRQTAMNKGAHANQDVSELAQTASGVFSELFTHTENQNALQNLLKERIKKVTQLKGELFASSNADLMHHTKRTG